MSDEQALHGGVANAGAVTRRGDVTLRPSTRFTASTQRFLRDVRAAGFDGAPEPRGVGADGRERLAFVEGDVPILPCPAWAQSDDVLASVVELVRRFHDAAAKVATEGEWNTDLADSAGGPIVCHNDVSFENVVFSDGRAVAILDWEFAAPGRPVYDLAQLARMCIPLDDDASAARLGWLPADRPARARSVCDVYGLSAANRRQFLVDLDAAIARHSAFVRRRVERGDPNFVAMWDAAGGEQRYQRRAEWWRDNRPAYESALA